MPAQSSRSRGLEADGGHLALEVVGRMENSRVLSHKLDKGLGESLGVSHYVRTEMAVGRVGHGDARLLLWCQLPGTPAADRVGI